MWDYSSLSTHNNIFVSSNKTYSYNSLPFFQLHLNKTELTVPPPKPSSIPSSFVWVQQSSQGRGRSPDFSDWDDRNRNNGSYENGSRSHQNSKGGTFSSHNNVANGTHIT